MQHSQPRRRRWLFPPSASELEEMIMIFAHQGGWDEMVMVLVPVALVVFLLRLANKRVKEQKLTEQSPRTKPTNGPGVSGRK